MTPLVQASHARWSSRAIGDMALTLHVLIEHDDVGWIGRLRGGEAGGVRNVGGGEGRGWRPEERLRLRLRLSGEVEVKVKQGTSNPLYPRPEPEPRPELAACREVDT